MPPFSGNPTDLDERLAYEVQTIDYLRATLHRQREAPGDGMSIVLGDVNEDGVQRACVNASGTISISEGAVRAALARLRPLAFGAAFKIQDMVAEWILAANGVTEWRFVRKLAAYDRLNATGALLEPDLFASQPPLARAFWELYRHFEPFRGTIVHSGGVTLDSGGTLVVVSRDSTTLTLTPTDQASYMRAMCLVAKVLSNQVVTDPFLVGLVESDLLQLQKYHAQAGLVVRRARCETLTVQVSPSHVVSQQPLSVSIDFDHLRRTMETAFPVGVDGQLYFSVSIQVQAGAREAVWQLPIEAIPHGVVLLHEGSAVYDQFLNVTLTKQSD